MEAVAQTFINPEQIISQISQICGEHIKQIGHSRVDKLRHGLWMFPVRFFTSSLEELVVCECIPKVLPDVCKDGRSDTDSRWPLKGLTIAQDNLALQSQSYFSELAL